MERTLKCHEKAASLGIAVDPLCLANADEKFATDLARAESRPPCFATGDAAAIEARIDTLVDGLVTSLRPSQTASRCAGKLRPALTPSKCAETKLQRASQAYERRLHCLGNSVDDGLPLSPDCVASRNARITVLFPEIEADAFDCLTTGDAAATLGAIEAGVSSVEGALIP